MSGAAQQKATASVDPRELELIIHTITEEVLGYIAGAPSPDICPREDAVCADCQPSTMWRGKGAGNPAARGQPDSRIDLRSKSRPAIPGGLLPSRARFRFTWHSHCNSTLQAAC